MKRALCIILALVMCIGLVACGSQTTPAATATPAKTATPSSAPSATAAPTSASKETYYISLGSASTGGYFYAMGGAIANIISQYCDGIQCTNEVTGGSAENVTLVGDDECQMGMANGNLVYAGFNGKAPFEKAYPEVRSMFAIQSSVFQIITLDKTGIRTVEDFQGKTICVGPAGGGQVNNLITILDHYKMTLDDFNPAYTSYSEGVENMMDGNVDAVVLMGAVPTAAVIQLAAETPDWHFIIWDEGVTDEMVASSTYFLKYQIPAGTYAGQDEDYSCVAASSVMMCRADMPDDIVYSILEAVYAHLDILVNTVDSAKEMAVDTGWHAPIDLHPAAERFFKDKGVLK